MPLRVTARIERYLTAPKQLIYNQKFRAECIPSWFLQQTDRAHYVESIVERPHRQFEVRVRVLFQPLEEHAYVLMFGALQDHFLLQDVGDPPAEWFGSDLSAAGELTRRFLYAMKAGRQDVLTQLVSPGVDTSRLTSDPCWQLQLQRLSQVDIGRAVLRSYKGLKIEITANVPGIFLVDRVNGEYKIVSAFNGIEKTYLTTDQSCRDPKTVRTSEDPDLESYTLKRFGLPISAVSASASSSETSQANSGVIQNQQSSMAIQQPNYAQPKQFSFQHRHINMFGPGNAIYYCLGILTIAADGTVHFDCTRTNDPTGRCDHTIFQPGMISDLKIRAGALHIAQKGVGNYDFYGDAGSVQGAYQAISQFFTRTK